jgi:soluble P-type ATPase
MVYSIPGRGELNIKTIIFDLNGTLTVAGRIVPGVHEKLRELGVMGYNLLFLSGNTRNDAEQLSLELRIDYEIAKTAAEKRRIGEKYDLKTCAAIGNGSIDSQLLEHAALGIVTLQAEGVAVESLLKSDILVPTINDALDLFLDKDRLIATLRK